MTGPRRRPCVTAHNTQNKQTSVLPTEFEPAKPASDRRQSLTLHRSAPLIGYLVILVGVIHVENFLQCVFYLLMLHIFFRLFYFSHLDNIPFPLVNLNSNIKLLIAVYSHVNCFKTILKTIAYLKTHFSPVLL